MMTTEQMPNADAGRLDRGVRRLAPLLACLAFVGCGDPIVIPPARAEARTALFKECMELAAKMPRQADDDVSDVVQECSTQAYYMTNYIK